MSSRKKAQDRAQDDKRVLWHLRKIPLLGGVPPARLQELISQVELREIPRRQVI